jgi:hypothetical protein
MEHRHRRNRSVLGGGRISRVSYREQLCSEIYPQEDLFRPNGIASGFHVTSEYPTICLFSAYDDFDPVGRLVFTDYDLT